MRLQYKPPPGKDIWEKEYQSLIPLGGKSFLPLYPFLYHLRGRGESYITKETLVRLIARDKDPIKDRDLIIRLSDVSTPPHFTTTLIHPSIENYI